MGWLPDKPRPTMTATLLTARSVTSGFTATAWIGCERYDGHAQKATAERMQSVWAPTAEEAKARLKEQL